MSQPHELSKDGGVQPLEQVPMMPGASSQRENAYLHGQENAKLKNNTRIKQVVKEVNQEEEEKYQSKEVVVEVYKFLNFRQVVLK